MNQPMTARVLNRMASPTAEESSPLLRPADMNRRPRLLVVDDQAVNVQALHQVFSSDHQVFMATSGPQALAVCAAKQPDLVLLDIVMPGMDGYQVCELLKADPATRDVPVIFVTAHSDEAEETHGLEVGAVDFIAKPINPKIVRARVKTHLTLKMQSDLLRDWVYKDGLTGVYNRRHFDERVLSEWGQAARRRSPLSVVMIDVDFFKRYNDHYGHQAGDDCLRRIAAELQAGICRPADLLARYGGEEFICLLPDTPAAGAMTVAQQLGQRVHDAAIEHLKSTAARVVTVSLGVSTKPEDVVGSAALLMREADVQLYRAKSQGRNQACGAELGGF